MTRIEAILVLIEAESRERLPGRDDNDYAAALYDVTQQVDALTADTMKQYREAKRHEAA